MSVAQDPSFELAGASHSRSHTVRFYSDDDGLARSVSTHLAEGLRAGDPAVVVATRPHGKAIVEGLLTQGFDPRALIKSGLLQVYDAAETLGRFASDDRIDAGRFDAVLSELLDRAADPRPRGHLRIYGEIVDLLWQDGKLSMAVYLEACWNRRLRQHGFSLLCAYRMDFLDEETDLAALDLMCGSHSESSALHRERLERAVDRAAGDLLGSGPAAILRSLLALNHRLPGWDRGGDTNILWIRRNLPGLAGPLLRRARRHFEGLADQDAPPPLLKPRPRPISILIVEDDADDLFFLQRAFANAAADVTLQIARDGEEAIRCLDGRTPRPQPALVLLDLKLPRRNGFELLEWIRTHSSFRQVPVVVHSSSQERVDVEHAYRSGANAFIGKELNLKAQNEMVRGLALYARFADGAGSC